MTVTRLIPAAILLAWLVLPGVRCDNLESELRDLFRTYDQLATRRELQQQRHQKEVTNTEDKREQSEIFTDMLRKLKEPTERKTLNRQEEARDMMDELLALLSGLSEGMGQVQGQTDSGSGKTAPTNKFGRRSNIMRDQARVQKVTPNVAGRSMDKLSARFNTEESLKKEVDDSKKATAEEKKEETITLEEPSRGELSDQQQMTRLQASYEDLLTRLLRKEPADSCLDKFSNRCKKTPDDSLQLVSNVIDLTRIEKSDNDQLTRREQTDLDLLTRLTLRSLEETPEKKEFVNTS